MPDSFCFDWHEGSGDRTTDILGNGYVLTTSSPSTAWGGVGKAHGPFQGSIPLTLPNCTIIVDYQRYDQPDSTMKITDNEGFFEQRLISRGKAVTYFNHRNQEQYQADSSNGTHRYVIVNGAIPDVGLTGTQCYMDGNWTDDDARSGAMNMAFNNLYILPQDGSEGSSNQFLMCHVKQFWVKDTCLTKAEVQALPAKPPIPPPPAPTGLAASGITASSFSLSWTGV